MAWGRGEPRGACATTSRGSGTNNFRELWRDHSRPFGHFVSQERIYRSQGLKQADVLMSAFLFPDGFPEAKLAVNYDYDEPPTTHDSSLSCVIHSILSARLGAEEEAYRLFERAPSPTSRGVEG